MLIASRHDIDLHGYHDTPTLTTVLRYARSYIPFEVAMDKAGKRTQQTFPLCDLGFRCSVPALLEVVAHQVKREQDRWQNPFDEFLKAAADVRDFYRELSRTDFENRLLRKWIVNSLLATVKSFSFGAATPRRHRRSC